MGKKKGPSAPESSLLMPLHDALKNSQEHLPIIDTHCHLFSTYSFYKSKYPDGQHASVQDFIRAYMRQQTSTLVEGVVDVYCEPPFAGWKDLADSALNEPEIWQGMKYNFVMGVHPHNAKEYDASVEKIIMEAMQHPLCVGWGEIGLDYHYDNSPRQIQQDVLIRQLQRAVELGKPITIHTREADDDIWRILSTYVPKETRLHIHCFTDSPELAKKLLAHFPNCFIGVTGVVTYSTNLNTSQVIKDLAASSSERTSSVLRLLLETDSPYMLPTNLPVKEIGVKTARSLATCHSGMIPFTAEFVAEQAGNGWTTEEVITACRENARKMYGV